MAASTLLREEKKVRKCYKCGTEINRCFGYVKAGDFLELIEGKRKKEDVRELCARCGLAPLFIGCLSSPQLCCRDERQMDLERRRLLLLPKKQPWCRSANTSPFCP